MNVSSRWPIAPLASVTERIFVGLPVARHTPKGDEAGLRVPVLTIAHLEHDHLVEPGTVPLRPRDYERFRVRRGDVLVACAGSQFKTALVDDDGPAGALASSTLIIVRPAQALLPELILELFLAPPCQAALRVRSRSGVAPICFTAKDVAGLVVPVPPMDVQVKLAELVVEARRSFRFAMAAARMRRELIDSTLTRLLLGTASGADLPPSNGVPSELSRDGGS